MARKKKAQKELSTTICKNRKAKHDYHIHEQWEAGLVLRGSEVKSCRQGRVNINDAFVRVLANEAYLIGAHIAEYKQASLFNHTPLRNRKLLLHRKQIQRLEIQLRQRGQSAIPLALYLKSGKIKCEIGLGKGRSYADKRDVVREREINQEIARVMKQRRS